MPTRLDSVGPLLQIFWSSRRVTKFELRTVPQEKIFLWHCKFVFLWIWQKTNLALLLLVTRTDVWYPWSFLFLALARLTFMTFIVCSCSFVSLVFSFISGGGGGSWGAHSIPPGCVVSTTKWDLCPCYQRDFGFPSLRWGDLCGTGYIFICCWLDFWPFFWFCREVPWQLDLKP